MMKLLIVGSDKIFAIENYYVKYLREEGCDVSQFPAQSIFLDQYQKSVIAKIFFRLGLSGILKKINQQYEYGTTIQRPDEHKRY